MPVSMNPDRSPFERAVNATGNASGQDKRPLGRRPDSEGDWAPEFISAIMVGATIARAAKQAGVHFTIPYKRRVTDEAFRKAWQEAADIGTEFLEQEAARRAYHGTLRPVFNKGIRCGYVREYSDILMMFMLKARRPEKYREGVEEGARGSIALSVTVVNVGNGEPQVTVDSNDKQDHKLEVVLDNAVEGGQYADVIEN